MPEQSSHTNELIDATHKLECFTAKLIDKPSTINLIREFFRPKKQKQTETLSQAVDTIQSQRLLVQHLQNGSPSDREIAKRIKKAVQEYNETISNTNRKSKKRSQSPLRPIQFPQSFDALLNLDPLPTKYAFSSDPTLSKQSPDNRKVIDLFHMKVLSSLESKGYASNCEARMQVIQAPIFKSIGDNSSQCTLRQTVTLYSGQTFIVTGTVILDATTGKIDRLIPSSINLQPISMQSGVPDPRQRAGWALSEQLIPECPQRMDLLTHTLKLFQYKQQISQILQDKDRIDQTKQFFKLKKQAFDTHSIELVALHKELAYSILHSSSEIEIVEEYFNTFEINNSFEALSTMYSTLRDHYLVNPHRLLHEAILKRNAGSFNHTDPLVRYQTVDTFLNDILQETSREISIQQEHCTNASKQVEWSFIKYMGEHIGKAAKQIILQYLSEDLIFTPPSLNLFERQLQIATCLQVIDFAQELTHPITSHTNAYQLMKKTLETDIALFQNKLDHHPAIIIVDELEMYYKTPCRRGD